MVWVGGKAGSQEGGRGKAQRGLARGGPPVLPFTLGVRAGKISHKSLSGCIFAVYYFVHILLLVFLDVLLSVFQEIL